MNFTSPAALNGLDNVNESGHINNETTLKHLKIITVICVASPDKLNHEAINGAKKNNGILHIQSPKYAHLSTFLVYIFACSFSPAPMHCPTTVISASPIDEAGIFAKSITV